MAITSVGYNGTVSDVKFAQLSQHSGSQLAVVCGRNDLAVSINSSAVLTCSVAAGSAEAPGVKATSDGVASVVFDAVTTSGQTRWDAVVLRYNWATGATALAVVKGTAGSPATQLLPAGVDLVLDSGYDQVLALVQLTNGQTLPTQVVDRRIWASKVFTAAALTSLPPPSAALYGTDASLINGDRYRCLVDDSNSPAWVKSTPTPLVASGVVTLNGNGTTGAVTNVTFPLGLFATAPAVSLTRRGSAGVTGKAIPYVGTSVSTSGFVCAVALGDGAVIPSGTVITVGWLAVL